MTDARDFRENRRMAETIDELADADKVRAAERMRHAREAWIALGVTIIVVAVVMIAIARSGQ